MGVSQPPLRIWVLSLNISSLDFCKVGVAVLPGGASESPPPRLTLRYFLHGAGPDSKHASSEVRAKIGIRKFLSLLLSPPPPP